MAHSRVAVKQAPEFSLQQEDQSPPSPSNEGRVIKVKNQRLLVKMGHVWAGKKRLRGGSGRRHFTPEKQLGY